MSDTLVLATALQKDGKILINAWSSNPTKVSAKELCKEIKRTFSSKDKGGFGGTDEQCQGAFYPDDRSLWEGCKGTNIPTPVWKTLKDIVANQTEQPMIGVKK